jgi:hypothetical protein
MAEVALRRSPSRRTGWPIPSTVAEVIATALIELTQRGWASFGGTLEEVTDYARKTGWQAVALRRGDDVITDLRAVTAAEARPNSISSRTGMGAQPLHTDGAHLETPPDVVAFASTCSHRASTRLWTSNGANAPWDDLRHGVFRVSDGTVRRLRFAGDGNSIRFDPCCMIPLDGRSRRVVRFFRTAFETAYRHQWSRNTPEVVLIDNRRTLHAREVVDSADPPRHLTRIAFRRPEAP